MARTDLTSGTDTNNNSVFATSSIAPTADNLVLAFVLSANTGFGAAGVPSASGNGLTWDRVDSGNAGQFRLTCFRAMRIGAAPASGTVRFEFRDGAGALQNQDLCAWSIFEYGNVDLGGTNGSGAVAVHPQAVATAATKLTAPLPLADQTNVQVGGIILALQLAQAAHPVTPGMGFAEIHELSPNQGVLGKSATLQTQDRTGGAPSIDWSWTGAESAVALVLEVKAMAPIVPETPESVVYEDDNEFIRAFEPILYFAPGERFFPADAKRYLNAARCGTPSIPSRPTIRGIRRADRSGPSSIPETFPREMARPEHSSVNRDRADHFRFWFRIQRTNDFSISPVGGSPRGRPMISSSPIWIG